MKKLPMLASVAALTLLVGTTPAAAIQINTSAQADIKLAKDEDRWKNWSFQSGIAGTVTATGSDSITIKTAAGTIYKIDTSDADMRGGTIETGDQVYVQGPVNGGLIVATVVINGNTKPAAPSADDKRSAITGTVTAKSGSTLTVRSKNGTTYTVAAADAKVWEKGDRDGSVADIDVDDAVVVQGTVSGSSVTATRIHVISFPEQSMNGGIRGIVTAKSGDTLTIKTAAGATYTVDTSDASFKDHKGETRDIDDIKVKESILVKGDVSGSTIEAETISEVKGKGKFFFRMGNFFKGIFHAKR